jgi:CubicO group peptidase (beta-lactamase class C family)
VPPARIRTAADLGLMQGTPPPVGRLVTLANWQEPPFNRWAFMHVRDLIPTARIRRGEGPARRLPRAERDLSRLRLRVQGRLISVDRFLEETYTDGFLVLHRGRVVTERYLNGLLPDTTHLLMSVSKSLTSSVCGVLVGGELLSPDAFVTEMLPELAGTSFEGCTVRHLLDMRAGTRFDENYDDPRADVRVYEQIYGWRPRTHRRLPGDACAYFASLRNDGPHGGVFRYRSILTDVLAWVMERVSGLRFAELVSRELWQPMGAEFDAEITVDGHGNPMADGGVCCTLRDLARFGQLVLDGGQRGDRCIVPSAWMRDTLTPDADTVAAFAASEDAHEFPRGAFYRNQWWVIDPTGPIFEAAGINGQMVFVHAPARVVVAKLSTWPEAWTPERSITTWRACVALAEELAAAEV